MKKHILIRILAALGGVTLWMLSLCTFAETFFHIPLTGKMGQLMNTGTPVSVLMILLVVIALGTFGTCCLMMLSGKHAARHKGFVMQKGENGMIGVSIKSIEGLVQTCVKQHDVIASADIAVVERRDGIVVLLNIKEAAGINIPLAVGALQKQIKQYVNTCTGVDVHEVRVMVENTEGNVLETPYTVESPIVSGAAAVVRLDETGVSAIEAPSADTAPVEGAPAEEIWVTEAVPAGEEAAAVQEPAAVPPVNVPAMPVAPMMPVMTEMLEEEDNRPLHQRLFGAEEQPVFVPAPPELVIEPAVEEAAEEAPAEAAEEISEETPAADEIEADAVLEVVKAIGAEEAGEMENAVQSESEDEAHE